MGTSHAVTTAYHKLYLMWFAYFSFGQYRIPQSTLENHNSDFIHLSVSHNILDPDGVRSSAEVREETHSLAVSALHLCSIAFFPPDVAALFQDNPELTPPWPSSETTPSRIKV